MQPGVGKYVYKYTCKCPGPERYIHTHTCIFTHICVYEYMNIVKKCNLPQFVFIVFFAQFNVANNKIILKELIPILP